MLRTFLSTVIAVLVFCVSLGTAFAQTTPLPYPILFVTQYPITNDFAAIASVFANHRASSDLVGRGGDLYIRYPDGSLRNLTQEAGYGSTTVFQGADSIAVRDPAVSWDGTKAIFSMVVGAPTAQYTRVDSFFQLYEATGLGKGQTVSIVKVPKQPDKRNNINPVYLSDNSILFASDNPRNGADHLYPQLDEYEEQPTPTGLWRLQPTTGQLELLQYAVSGSFNPIVDSFGRVIFTRWDHLQRDQQNDYLNNDYKTFNYTNESLGSVPTTDRSEVFPEPRDPVINSNVNGLRFNQFFPWMVNQDGTAEETLNHVGRHEFYGYIQRSLTDDPALGDLNVTHNTIQNLLQIREDPTRPGRYVGIAAPEFSTKASGQIVRIDAAPGVNAATITATYLNPESDRVSYDSSMPVPTDFTGHFRNPLPLSDGRMIAAHTAVASSAAASFYDFRLKLLSVDTTSGYFEAASVLTPGISKSVSYYDPDALQTYNGPFWELSPVEVRARAVPPATASQLGTPEQQAFTLENVDPQAMRTYLRANGLALVVMRNVTTRDSADLQQPYNLRVAVPGGTQTVAAGATKTYDIKNLQLFQGDQIRGLGYAAPGDVPGDGRRVLAQAMHDGPTLVANGPNPNSGAPGGSTPIAADGSVALFVPARRALAWHELAPDNTTPVVRERYWLTFQPGEIRACDGCHGVNQLNQAAQPPATNVSQALRALLARWRDKKVDLIFTNSLEER